MRIKLKYFDPIDLTTLGLNPKELKVIEDMKWFEKGGRLVTKNINGNKLLHILERYAESSPEALTKIDSLPEKTLNMLLERSKNNEFAIDIYRQRMNNGGTKLVKERGTKKYNASDIRVFQDSEELRKYINELDALEHPLPDVGESWQKELLALRHLYADAVMYSGNTPKNLAVLELEIKKIIREDMADYQDKDLLFEYVFTPDSPKLKRYKTVLHFSQSETGKTGFADENFIWAPNKENMENNYWREGDRRAHTDDINYWQTTLPHEFEHAYQNGDLVYLKFFQPKHAISAENLKTGNFTEDLLKAMHDEMEDKIGIRPTSLFGSSAEQLYLSTPTELLARGTQIKNWLGITNPKQALTAKDIKEAKEFYVATGVDNNMTSFLASIVDPKKAAKFLSYATMFTGAVVLPVAVAGAVSSNKNGGTLKMQEGGILEEPVYQDFKIPEQLFVFRHLANEEQAKQFDLDLADLFYREEIKYGLLTKEGRQELLRKYNLSLQQVEDTLDDLLGFGLGEALVADLLQTDQEISIDKVVDKSIDFDKQGGVLKMSFGGAAMRALVPKAAESLTAIVPKIGTSEALQLLIKALANGEMTELTLNAIARGKSDELIKALKRTDTFKDLLKGEKVITEADTKILDALFHPGGAPVAAEYLLTGTPGIIKSTGYFLTGLTGVFPLATNDIKKVALKYGDDIMNNGEFANFILNPKFQDMMADMKKAISKTYGKGGETSLDIIMSSPTGLNPKQGNLVEKLLAEGELELVSNEILKDKRPPKDLFTDNTTFRKGGKINKYSIGAAIKKFAKGLDEVVPIAEKTVTKETAEQVFRTSGTSKVIGKATTEHLQKVATATGDKRILVLADFAVQCRDKGIKLPEEFNKFVDSIFKTPTVVSSDTKKIRVGKEKVAEPEVIEWHGLKQERPTFEKTKHKTKIVHTGEFKDKLEFKRTIPLTEQELAELSPKVDEAINSLVKMMNGEEFKLTDTMMDEIYLKSKGMVLTFGDSRANGQKLRQLFSEIEYPTIVKRLLSENYVPPVAPSPELEKFYQASKENLDWYGKVKNASLQYVWLSPRYEGPLGNIEITPLRISPKKKELAVYNTHDGYLSFLPSQIMTKRDRPYVKAYRATIDGVPVKGMPTFNFDEHHSNPLSLMLAEAYLLNPMPTSSMEHVRDYQRNRTKSGSKDSFYDLFLALLKELHTGKEGIHYADKFSLQDLLRIKALSRSGRFKTMEDLLAYYSKIKTEQLKYFT